jgi:hypothetical protein
MTAVMMEHTRRNFGHLGPESVYPSRARDPAPAQLAPPSA